jgi:hypothetical protein
VSEFDATLQAHFEHHGKDKVAQIRALSFSFRSQMPYKMSLSNGGNLPVGGSGDARWQLLENDAMDFLFGREDGIIDDDDGRDCSIAADWSGHGTLFPWAQAWQRARIAIRRL